MEAIRESTAVSDTATSTIPGPYVSPERTESIPLKGAPTSSSSGFFARCCRNCVGFADDDAGDGLKFIIVTFIILSAAITVALVSQIYQGDFQVVPHGSVATDNLNCSVIGTDILKKDGNAVDAAVASTLCMGVVNPHITGLGGGGFMLVYDHRKSEILESLDFRETAPRSLSHATQETIGPATVGVPGLVSGLFAVHKAYGKLSWSDVVKPAADIARSGFLVPSSLVAARAQLPPRSGINGMLHDFLDTLEAGQKLKRPTLGATLELLAKEGPDGRYYPSNANWWWKSYSNALSVYYVDLLQSNLTLACGLLGAHLCVLKLMFKAELSREAIRTQMEDSI